MIKSIIEYLNSKLVNLGYFNKVEALAEKIEREGKIFPAIYRGNGEYQGIELDPFGSICYWRKNGDVSTLKQDNDTTVGTQYQIEIPLKLICFLKKEVTSDQYFADNICSVIISELTSPLLRNNLKSELKAKRVSVFSSRYVTDSRAVEKDEYDDTKIDTIRYTHAHFSIDFTLTIIMSSQCVPSLCANC